MTAVARTQNPVRFPRITAWWLVIGLPAAFALLSACEPRWVFMWAIAFGIYAGLKGLSLIECPAAPNSNRWRWAAYLLLWPGMDARAFLDRRRDVPAPSVGQWLSATLNLAVGISLLIGAVPRVAPHSLVAAAWIGLSAICFVLHFGVFKLLALTWRQLGVDAEPIMNAPYRSTSLAEFWGRRWNLAFRDLAHNFVFRPLVGRLGPAAAALIVFLASGLIHDVVISGGAGCGFGKPTLYFLLQAVGLFGERSALGRHSGLGRGWVGRIFCGTVTVGPLSLLFHRPFLDRVVVPMLEAFGLI
jgi:alginate O-acetyltransferase complex protein AlgI